MDEVKSQMVFSDRNLIRLSQAALSRPIKREDKRFHEQRIVRCEARIKRATS